MLRTRFRPSSVAMLAALAAAVAGIAGCGTVGRGSAVGPIPPGTSTAGSTSSRAVLTRGTARHERASSAVMPRPTAPPAAAGYRAYCAAGEIPVPFRRGRPGNCGGATCSSATAAGSRSDRPGARTRFQPGGRVFVLPCGWPARCICPPFWRLSRLNGSVALPGGGSPPRLAGEDGSSPGKVVPVQVCLMGRAG